MPRPLTALVLAAAIAGLAACGESDQEQAREVVQDYVEARTGNDYDAECDLYSESFKEELAVEDCPAFVEEQSSGAGGEEELEVVDVRVMGDRATADIDIVRDPQIEGGPARITLLLVREDGEWRIARFQ